MFWQAGVDFLLVIFMGVLIGLAIAHIAYAIHRWLPTTSSIDTAITLISPYLMYITAEHFHYSGVLAVVSGGLFLSYRSHDIFSYESRLQSQSVWNVLIFLLNGVVFILIGLQMPAVIRGLGEYSLHAAFVSDPHITEHLFEGARMDNGEQRVLEGKLRTVLIHKDLLWWVKSHLL